jgi:hypothetical protein
MPRSNFKTRSSNSDSGEKEMKAEAYVNFFRCTVDPETNKLVPEKKLQITMGLGNKLGQVSGFKKVIASAQARWDEQAKAGMTPEENTASPKQYMVNMLGEKMIAEIFLPQMLGLTTEVENEREASDEELEELALN